MAAAQGFGTAVRKVSDDGTVYTVEHYKPPEDKEPPPTWDASRSNPPPGPSREKLRRVLQEEAKRAVHQSNRLPAYTKSTWDADRPAGGDLPYFDYKWSAAEEPAYMRDDLHYAGRIDYDWPFLEHRAARRDRCMDTAWHSSKERPYETLGSVHLVPAALKRRPAPSPLTILGNAWVPAAKEDRGEVTSLVSGAPPVSASVPAEGTQYYSIGAILGQRLTLKLTTLSGDPDLYVSQLEDRPDAETHTWRSLGAGEVEILQIEPDDPKVDPAGTFWICVYGGRSSDYKLEASLAKPPIHLPPRKKGGHERGLRDPPPGYTWADLPSESRLVQAITEASMTRGELTARVREQLTALEAVRPYRQLTQAYSLAALPPSSVLCRPKTVRDGARSMLGSYARRRYPVAVDESAAASDADVPPSPAVLAHRHLVASEAGGGVKRIPFFEHELIKTIDSKYKAPHHARVARQGARKSLVGSRSRGSLSTSSLA